MGGWQAEQPRVLSSIPGRLRVHLPNGNGVSSEQQIVARLRQMLGVEAVQANPLTGNVLIHFDANTTSTPALLAAVQQHSRSDLPPGENRGLSPRAWLRVGARGLLGHAVVDTLWFGAGFLGKRLGLPLGALGPLHLLMDVLVWGAALGSGRNPGERRGAEPGGTP
jgi:hypothetical protein